MEPTSPTTGEGSSSRMVFAGMGALYVLMCLCLGAFLFVARQQIPGLQNYFPTETFTPGPTSTPTATPVVHKPRTRYQVYEDDFSSDVKNWWSNWHRDQAKVTQNGKLSVHASKGYFEMTRCTPCKFDHENFYLEADFATDKEIDENYGFAFNTRNAYDDCYVFMINPVEGSYSLYKKTVRASKNLWMMRISKDSKLIKAYPATNQLAIYFNKDYFEFYINGTMVDTYHDPGTSLTDGYFGFYVEGGDFQLLADNLFGYSD